MAVVAQRAASVAPPKTNAWSECGDDRSGDGRGEPGDRARPWSLPSLLTLTLAGCAAGAAPPSSPASQPPAVNAAASPEPPTQNAPRRVAITIDDLGVSPASAEPALSARILAQLGRARAPVAVFVNCEHLRADSLELWRAAGAIIGNHTQQHASLDETADPGMSRSWWDGVARCHERLTELLGTPVRYFRFPYLRYGATEARKREAAEHLASLQYRVAHVTAATSEWLLAQYYELALEADDAAFARSVADDYVAHMVETLDAAERFGAHKGIADAPQITLLHVNRLAGDHLADVLAALSARGWHFISLADALADPLYARSDEYVGGCGCSWLARVAPALRKTDEYVFGDHEERIRAKFEPRAEALRKR